MVITYNNITDAENLITFDTVPNILDIDNTKGEKTVPSYFIEAKGGNDEMETTEIWFGDSNIQGSNSYSKCTYTTFYIAQANTAKEKNKSILTVMRALKNVPEINASFDIYLDTDTKIVLMGKDANSTTMNRQFRADSTLFSTGIISTGNTGSEINVGNDTVATVDIYTQKEPTVIGINPSEDTWQYYSTLTKTVHSPKTKFDLTPILSSFGEGLTQYRSKIYVTDGDEIVQTYITPHNYFTHGYGSEMGQIEDYLVRPSLRLAAAWTENLSVYEPELSFSIYRSEGNIPTFRVRYLDGLENEIFSETPPSTPTDLNKSLQDYDITLIEEFLVKSTYIELQITPSGRWYRYKVIQPLAATGKTTRIYWRNEYGGVSFMDLTGEETVRQEIETETYSRNRFDYYDGDTQKKRVQTKKVTNEISVQTHVMGEAELEMLYSMEGSRDAWTKDGKIDVTNLEVAQSANSTHLFIATVTYNFL